MNRRLLGEIDDLANAQLGLELWQVLVEEGPKK